MRACTVCVLQAFDCVGHVITSEACNWYLVYRAEAGAWAADDGAEVEAVLIQAGLELPQRGKDVFLSYVSPIHYNAVSALGAAADQG